MEMLKITTEDVAAIRAMGSALDSAALSGDYKALTGLFTEDALLMGANMPVIKGRSKLFEFLESSGMTISEHEVDFMEIDGYGDLAYAVCSYVESVSVEGSEVVKEEGKILGIFRKQPNESWLIDRWSWNSGLPISD